MAKIRSCIYLPEELEQYRLHAVAPEDGINVKPTDFGIKFIKNDYGELERADYYSNSGELLKKIYYNNSEVSTIMHYRNSELYSEETYSAGYLQKKIIYDKNGNGISYTDFKYNQNNQICLIKKTINNNRYEVRYGYDELKRVNCRRTLVNLEEVNNQTYKYDILDRIIEYKDLNQHITVMKMNQNNNLVSYQIEDKNGNNINIQNKFLYTNYVATDVELNGHKTTVNDENYMDNILLRKPRAGEEDLDYSISGMYGFNMTNTCEEIKADVVDISETKSNISKDNILPISIRKKLLLKNSA